MNATLNAAGNPGVRIPMAHSFWVYTAMIFLTLLSLYLLQSQNKTESNL